MRCAITVSLVPQARGGPFVFWDDLAAACEQAAMLGFDGIEIFPSSAAEIDVAHLEDLLGRHHLRLAAMGTGAGWLLHRWTLTSADAGARQQAREFARAIIELAASFGAPAIIGSMQGRAEGESSRERVLARLAEAFEDLGEHARSLGVPLLYEPLNRYETNLFNRLDDTARWLRASRAENVRILADLFHMNIEESDLTGAVRAAGPLIGHVHFADSDRRAIGFAHIDVAPIIAALREIGYDGYLSAEVLPLPTPAAAARQTIESFRRFTQQPSI